jgi:hypothetical protein
MEKSIFFGYLSIRIDRKELHENKNIYCETPILKAQHIGIGKLNNPALAEGNETQASETKYNEA